MTKIATKPVSKFSLFMRFWGWFALIFLFVSFFPLAATGAMTYMLTQNGPGDYLLGIGIAGFLGLVFGSVGAGFTFFAARKAHRAVRLRDTGEERRAVVDAIAFTNITLNNVRQKCLVWTDETGMAGKSMSHNPEDIAPYPAGTEITIYAEAMTNKSVWQGDVGEAAQHRYDASTASTRSRANNQTIRRG